MNFSFVKLPVFNGKPYASIEEAQKAALVELFDIENQPAESRTWSSLEIAEQIIEKREEIMDVLTTTINSKPSARKINGGTKKRKAKPAAVAPTEPQLAIDPAI